MRVLTFNVWNFNSSWPRRRRIIADLILGHEPDAVALQETRQDFRFDRGMPQGEQLAELTSYHLTSRVAHTYLTIPPIKEGLSILTRREPLSTMTRSLTHVRFARGDGNRRVVLGVRLQHDGQEVDIYDTHFSLSAAVRKLNAREVNAFVRQQSGQRPSVLMGDLNAEPETSPIRYLIGEEEVHGEAGDMIDLWKVSRGDSEGFTYASWEPVRRIDYVLGRNVRGASGAEVVGGQPVDSVYASDHMGVLVDVEV